VACCNYSAPHSYMCMCSSKKVGVDFTHKQVTVIFVEHSYNRDALKPEYTITQQRGITELAKF